MMIGGAILVALILLYWLVQVAMLTRCMHVIPVLDVAPRVPLEHDELVSVIVPARDEEEGLEPALRSRLNDRDPHLQFIFINDRSSDSTGSIMERVALDDPRVEVIHVESLPDGWLGKVHAMQAGVEKAHGEWLLLSDADVHVAVGTVRTAVDQAIAGEVDHLAAIPSISSPSIGLRFCLVPLLRTLAFMVRLWSVHDPASTAAMGVGAFNLVRHSALEHAGGLASLRMEVIDDIGIGTIIKQHGGGSLVAAGRKGIQISWYNRFDEFLLGIERGTAHLPRRIPRILLAIGCVMLFLLDAGPFLLLFAWPWSPALGWIGLTVSSVVVLLSILLARFFGLPLAAGAAAPVGMAIGLYAAIRCIMKGGRDGSINWRGTSYKLEDLRAGERVGFHEGRFRSSGE